MICSAAESMGFPAFGLDRGLQQGIDISSPDIMSIILKWLRDGLIFGVTHLRNQVESHLPFAFAVPIELRFGWHHLVNPGHEQGEGYVHAFGAVASPKP